MSSTNDGLFQYGGVPVQSATLFGSQSKVFFVDPVNGSDGNRGNTPARAFSTLYMAHSMCTAGNNDTVYLIGNGASSGTARLSAAGAALVDPTATVGTLVWSKNATHLIGVSAASADTRARISNVTTETLTTFGSGNLVSVTAAGCVFANFSVYHGLATGGASEIAWTDSGGRNQYTNVIIQGGGDTASTTTNSATMRSLLISGTVGENVFTNCTIGLDTLSRTTTASAEMEITGGSPRNVFRNCIIRTNAGAAGNFWLKIGANGIDRYVLFQNCTFVNPIGSGATTMTVGASVNASPGGLVLAQDCLSVGATNFDTASKTYSNMPAAATGGGLGVVTG